MTKKPEKKDKNKKPLTASELAEALGTRYGTIKFYSELGLLPFQQEGQKARRYYELKEAQRRFKTIRRLKEKRLTIKEIIDYFKKQNER